MSVLRRVLVFGMVAVLLLCGVVAGLVTWAWTSTKFSNAGQVAFTNPLSVPPLAASTVDQAGRRVFDLRAGEGRHDFGGRSVPTWGFNGDHLGPTLRATRGEQVVVNVHNGLAETTSVHWHGMHLPARMDGGPHQSVRPGGTWSPTWTVDQPAATLWYHPHPHGETARHVYRGLAGMFLVDDPATDAPDLPHRYGVDDVPVIVQDKAFEGNRLDEDAPLFSAVGVLGRSIAVNGTLNPYLDVTTDRLRLRLLNASNARAYHLGFADGRSFALVGTDGGLLPAPHATTGVTLAAGERAEIIVVMRPGERTVLRSTPPPLGLDGTSRRFSGSADTFDILQLRAAPELVASPRVPTRLVDVPRLDPARAVQHRQFTLSGTAINRREMEPGRVDATVVKDSVEIWTVTNNDGTPHSFHVHDVQFQVLTVGGQPPPAHLRGWKDTVHLLPHRPIEIIARFADHADPATPYMFHCHVLDHEDDGMMGQFVVVEPGQQPSVATGSDGHDHGGSSVPGER